jgi:hypothetical protein
MRENYSLIIPDPTRDETFQSFLGLIPNPEINATNPGKINPQPPILGEPTRRLAVMSPQNWGLGGLICCSVSHDRGQC